MNPSTYLNYTNIYTNTESISDKQIAEMECLMNEPDMKYLKETINIVTHKRRRLEQECIEVSDIATLLRGDKT